VHKTDERTGMSIHKKEERKRKLGELRVKMDPKGTEI
jgi:hypothetical protein